MERVFLDDALLLDPEAGSAALGALLIEDGRIRAHLPAGSTTPGECRRIDLAGRGLAPGFIDLHYHGDLVFLEPAAYAAASSASSASLLRHGTTGYLPTTLAWGQADLLERVGALAEIVARAGAPGAQPLGLHLEGPWINGEAAGAQPIPTIRPPALHEVSEILDRGEGTIRMVTFAPEIEGAASLQLELAKRGVVGALGHSRADADAVEVAVERGASHVTHLFNAMGPLHHRAPGLAGTALVDERLTCDLICDGAHVHRSAVRLAARALADRLLLITDRVSPPDRDAEADSGSPASASFDAGALHDDGVAIRFADGRLAGSSVTLDIALRNFRDFAGATLLDAVKACTLRPARVLGVESERGTLRPGAVADFAVLDESGSVLETWVGGRQRYAVEG